MASHGRGGTLVGVAPRGLWTGAGTGNPPLPRWGNQFRPPGWHLTRLCEVCPRERGGIELRLARKLPPRRPRLVDCVSFASDAEAMAVMYGRDGRSGGFLHCGRDRPVAPGRD